MVDKDEEEEKSEFTPRGTIVILIIFLITLILLWGYVYLILLQRGVTI